MITRKLKKRFCNDLGIEIQTYDEPYFSERIELLGYTEAWNKFKELLQNKYNNNEEAFFEEYDKIKNKVIAYITKSEAFKSISNDEINNYDDKIDIVSDIIYKEEYIGEEFISIRLAKADFSALAKYADTNGLEFNSDQDGIFNYPEFMRKFTDNGYLVHSKHLRHLIFGVCNSNGKMHCIYQKYLMSTVLETLVGCALTNITKKDVVTYSNDEVVIKLNDTIKENIEGIRGLVIMLGATMPLKFEYFKLGKVTNSDAYIKKIYYTRYYTDVYSYDNEAEFEYNLGMDIVMLDNIPKSETKYSIENADSVERIIIEKTLRNMDITENDLVFCYKGRLAKLIKNPELQIEFGGNHEQ